MNILAIRLKNLASLAGEHEIDFTQEPLASAGLFAITGPTGAGKSTLLDALCLALFGSTPRLTGVSLNNKVPDGDDELGGGDERNLLRRGCANGYAEVDFVGLDGDHYRARWEVRRARDRATGRLQSSQQSLHNLTTQQVLASGKKREFHDALEAKLGLSFAQFTRAVLLAQSEFSAFLKADDNERGSLLEKLTDTALYSRLGQAAYEKRKQAQAERDQLERQLGDIKPLDNDARAALEQQLNDAETALQQLNKTREEWLAQSQWLDSADTLQAQLSQAQSAKTDAQSAWDNLASARELIEQFDACADVREPYMRRQRLLEQQQRLSEQQPAIEARAQQTKAAVEQTQAQLNAANESYNAAQTQQKNAEPAIAEARVALQATLAAEQQLAQTQRALTLAESELSQAQTQLKDTERKHSELSEQQQQLQRALEPSAELESLIDGWPLLSESWQNLLRQRAQLQRLIAAKTQLNTVLISTQNAAIHAEQPIIELQAKYQQQPLNPQLQALGDQLTALDRELAQLHQQQDVWQRYQDAEHQCAELEQAFKAAAAQCEQIITDGKQARATHEQASAELKSLQTVLEAQRLARLPSVEELRQQLQPDSPCPVCGSLEHPLHSSAAQEALNRQAAADDQLLAEAEAKVHSANERLLTLRDQHITLNSQQKLRHEQLEREQRNRTALLDRLTALALPEAFWQQAPSAQQHWFTEQHSALTQQRTAVAERIEQCRADQAQLETLYLALNAAQEALRAQQQAVDKNASDCEHVQQTLDSLSTSLLARLPADYHELLASDEPSTYQQLDARIQQRMAQQQQLRALEPELAECSTILRQQQNALPSAQTKQQSALNEATQAQQTYDHAASALRSCLGEHHSIELWQQQLSTQREAALNRLNQCRDHEAQQQLALQAAEHALQSLQTRLEEIRTEYTLADHQVKTWLTEHLDWQPEQLAQLMALPSEHVQRQRQQVAEAKDALSRAEERYLSVEQQWQTHQQRYPQAPTREKVAAQLEQLKTQFDAQQSEAERLRSECLLDDQRRLQANQWLAQLDQAQATYLRWAKLADLIGSADGAAFRRIAQGYNLDLLVQHANVQLRQLAKRYRLQRGGSPLGLLVLDTDMGDELRSVHSLSGGETFLVSLALALGLASMASSKMPINSLFIDEGFGSLDPESLQVAMDALDNLQAQGRKVAVISHVAEMHERIPVKVQVQRQGNGQSSVQIVAG